MKKRVLFSLVILISAFTTSSFAQSAYKETRDAKDFDEVSFSLSGEIYITIGNEYKVVLEGDKEDINEVETKVMGHNLEIKRKDSWGHFVETKVNAYITLPAIKAFSIAGSAKGFFNDPLKADKFDLSIAGSGKVYFKDVEMNYFNSSIAGSGRVEISGKGGIKEADLSISGSGTYIATDAVIETMKISIAGSGKCECNVTGFIKGSIAGSGNILYTGNPKIDASVFGSGRIMKK
jgi:hypothetical protein